MCPFKSNIISLSFLKEVEQTSEQENEWKKKDHKAFHDEVQEILSDCVTEDLCFKNEVSVNNTKSKGNLSVAKCEQTADDNILK